MKIVMLCFMDDGKKIQLKPDDVVDTSDKKCPIDDAEAARLIAVGGARRQTDAEVAADLAPKTDGPTVGEWVKAGYKASNYPPSGYASRSTAEEIAAAIEAEKKTA